MENKNASTPIGVDAVVMPIVKGEVKIIYKHNKPYGIRDSTGYLFFFPDRHRYTGQDERYRLEVEQQYRLADYLAKALREA